MTVAHFLGEKATVFDPHPDRYKIGESIIPQHFYHPRLAPLVERIRLAPSACPKAGTLFVTKKSASYFPILDDAIPVERARAVHVERAELERIAREFLKTATRSERVVAIDFDAREVETSTRRYRVHGLVIDCSGPAMFVARQLGLVRELWPIWAGWGYFDVERIERERFFRWLQSGEREYLRYDGVALGLVRGGDADAWDPSHVTMLTAIEEGIWSWQIPLFGGKRLSFGIVSRKGPVTPELYRELTLRALGPQYVAKLRPFDHTGPFSVFHQRQRFAQVATELAGEAWALVGDAAFFGDPVYSVGTGVATSHAIQLAELLNQGQWSREHRDAWQRQQRATFARIEEAYQNWYGGEVVADDRTATKIQNDFLIGDAFRVRLAEDYMSLWAAAEPEKPGERSSPAVGPDSWVAEARIGSERVLLLLESDPDRVKKALAHGAGHALSHLDLELGPASRPVVLELGRRFARAEGSEDVLGALRKACPASGRIELWRRLFPGQRVPRWPLALRSGRPRPGSLWPFDAESAALDLGIRRAMFREARSADEAASDERWLKSQNFLVQRRGHDLVAARERAHLEHALTVISTEVVSNADFVTRARELGSLFGYPACCVDSFVRIRRRDDVMLFADVLPRHAEPVPPLSLFVNGSLSLVSHAPCSAQCPSTLELARALLESLDASSAGFAQLWLALARRLHAIDDRGRCFAFELEAPARLSVRSGVEIVAPSPNVTEPQLRPVAMHSLSLDRDQGVLVSDEAPELRSSLFARHDG